MMAEAFGCISSSVVYYPDFMLGKQFIDEQCITNIPFYKHRFSRYVIAFATRQIIQYKNLFFPANKLIHNMRA